MDTVQAARGSSDLFGALVIGHLWCYLFWCWALSAPVCASAVLSVAEHVLQRAGLLLSASASLRRAAASLVGLGLASGQQLSVLCASSKFLTHRRSPLPARVGLVWGRSPRARPPSPGRQRGRGPPRHGLHRRLERRCDVRRSYDTKCKVSSTKQISRVVWNGLVWTRTTRSRKSRVPPIQYLGTRN